MTMMRSGGERQVGTRLEEIRLDHRERYLWAIKHMESPNTVLDAGCGVGYGSRMLSDHAERVIGVDISPETIEFANRYWKNDRIEFEIQDLQELRFKNDTVFDVVVAFESLEHLAVPELFLLRLRTYITSETKVFVSSPNQAVYDFDVSRTPYHIRHYTEYELRQMLRRVGFQVTKMHSQDEDEIRDDLDGRFLLAQCCIIEKKPQISQSKLREQVGVVLQEHSTLMGNAIARFVGVSRQKEELDKVVKDLRNKNAELSQANSNKTAALEAAEIAQEEYVRFSAGLEVIEGAVQSLTARLIEQDEKTRAALKASRQGQESLQQTVESLRVRLVKVDDENDLARSTLSNEIRAIRENAAIRRLVRVGVIAYKLKGLLRLKKQIASRKSSDPPVANSPVVATVPQTQLSVQTAKQRVVSKKHEGKKPAPDSELRESVEVYRGGFCSLSHVYRKNSASEQTDQRLVIDVSRLFDHHLTGVGHFCRQLTQALLRRSPHKLVLFSTKALPQWILDYEGGLDFVHYPSRHSVRGYSKLRTAPDLKELTGPYDAYFHTSASHAPVMRADNQISVVYDLAPLSCPETVPERVVQSCVEYTKHLAAHSKHLIAISEFTKRELVDFSGVDPDKIDVIHVGMDSIFRRPITEADRARTKAKLGLDFPYILCVGTLQPRKNLIRLIEAYDLLKQRGCKLPKLVLTGTDRWAKMEEFDQKLSRLQVRDEIIWTGYIDRSDMPALYAMSQLFVYPSYFEGYGMPVAEAMACGAPVVCGNLTSLPEVAGDAAVYCDPLSTESIAEAILNTVTDFELLQQLREKSLQQAQTYLSWNEVADRYLEIYEKVRKTNGSKSG